MLIINNLQKLDPSHVPAQAVTKWGGRRKNHRLMADSRLRRKKAQGVFKFD
jgi:hypothetical protein